MFIIKIFKPRYNQEIFEITLYYNIMQITAVCITRAIRQDNYCCTTTKYVS